MSDLNKYTVIKNRTPLGLNNIIQQLRIELKYVTEEDLKDNNFYEMIFPDLYPKQTGYVSNIIGGIKSFWNFAGGKIGCKEENDNDQQQMALRTDISDEDRYKNIPEKLPECPHGINCKKQGQGCPFKHTPKFHFIPPHLYNSNIPVVY